MLAVTDALSLHRSAAVTLAALVALAALAAVLLLLPTGAWLGATGVPVLGLALAVAEARRGGVSDLQRVQHLPGE